MKTEVFIHAIGTAVPDQVIFQEKQLERILAAVPEDEQLQAFISRIYGNSGITKRHTVLSESSDFMNMSAFIPDGKHEHAGPTTQERNRVFADESPQLSIAALDDAFRQVPEINPADITHLITVSCTGFAAPGFNFQLIKHFTLSPEIACFHIGFMGCFGAFPALRLAHSLCQADRRARVIVLCCELCSLHYRHSFDSETIVANSLFADGAAAVIISANQEEGRGHGIKLNAFYSRILSDSENQMGWIIGNHGFRMVLSRSIPSLIERNLNMILSGTAIKAGIREDRISSWAIHPGGRAILDRTARALDLSRDALVSSYSVLSNYGNMSSASVLFVAKNFLDTGVSGTVFSAAFGPGLTSESAIFEVF